MTSILKEWVYLYELPFKIQEKMKQGYTHFKFDVLAGEKKRIQLKAWKEVEYSKNFECEGTGTQECEIKRFNNPVALDLHKRKHGHGKYELRIPA